MLVEKLLARLFQNLDATAAARLIEELDEARWALETLQGLAEEDKTGRLENPFDQWRLRLEERRARVVVIYPTRPGASSQAEAAEGGA